MDIGLPHETCDLVFSGGYEPICSIWSTLAPHLAFRFGLSQNIDKLTLCIAYLTYLLICLW